MSSDEEDDRRQNGSRRRKRPVNGDDAPVDDVISKEKVKRKRRIIDDEDDEDSDKGETEFADEAAAEKNTDSPDSLEKKTSKTKIKPIARKKDGGGNEDVTSSSSSPSRLISSILNRVNTTTRSSPSDVRSSRPSQDTTKDKASKVPKKAKAAEAPKSLLANMSMRPPPAKEEPVKPRPAPKPVSRPPPSRSEVNNTTHSRPSRPTQSRPKATPSSAPQAPQKLPQIPAEKPPSRSKAYKLVEAAVVQNLQELCATTKIILPPNNTRQRIDLGGSFLPTEETQDFFDRNEAGDITLEQRKPIFPEDFPPGMKDHDLSWWGIVDPKIEQFRSKQR